MRGAADTRSDHLHPLTLQRLQLSRMVDDNTRMHNSGAVQAHHCHCDRKELLIWVFEQQAAVWPMRVHKRVDGREKNAVEDQGA